MLRIGRRCAVLRHSASKLPELAWVPTPPRSYTSSTGTREACLRSGKPFFFVPLHHEHNPAFDAKWQTHVDGCDRIVWEEFWG